MRRHFIVAVIGGLVLPIAGLCAAADVAAIRNLAIVRSSSLGGAGSRHAASSAGRALEAAKTTGVRAETAEAVST